MPDPGRMYRSGTNMMSLAMVIVGVALIVRTIAAGGSPIAEGILLGLLFVVGGGLRFWVGIRRSDEKR